MMKKLSIIIFLISISLSSFCQEYSIDFSKVIQLETLEQDAIDDIYKDLKREYVTINFNHSLTAKEHNALEEDDILLLEYYGDNSYMASCPKNFKYATLEAFGVLKLRFGPLNNSDVDRLTVSDIPDYSRSGEKILLSVQYPRDMEALAIEELCGQYNIEILASSKINNIISIAINKKALSSLYELPFLYNIEVMPPPGEPEDQRGRNLHRVNAFSPPHTFTQGFTGAGVNIMVRDDGQVFEHIDFTGRLEQSRNSASRGSHGDGVAGIMGGAGNLDPDHQGMAYGSNLFTVSYSGQTAPLFLDPGTTFHLTNNDIRITNTSFANGCNLGYSNQARVVDQQTFDNPELMHVFSAGNMGQENCSYGAGTGWGNITGGHKTGKNVIAIASTDFLGSVVPSSSRGPARDGRIKPDIAANGANHISTAESQGYMVFNGTSAAAPVVAGVMGILHEAHESLIGSRAPAALLKAIMLNSADEAGNLGPDFQYGFGLLNGRRALKTIEEVRFRAGTINQGESQNIEISIPANARGVKVMTYWPDPEANVSGANKALLNDIDTRIDDGTNLHLPFILSTFPDPDSLNLPARRGVDHLNNMEQILVEGIGASALSLTLEGFDIPFGQADFYVTWEYITDEIVVTFPNGGENLEANESEFIYWDADGTDGQFLIEVIDEQGNVVQSSPANGGLRMAPLAMPGEFTENLKIRVSRNGFEDLSDSTFAVSSFIENSKMEKQEADLVFTWDSIQGAISYNVFVLGDKYMEKTDVALDTSFVLPDDPLYKNSWIAVSANFPSGAEGKRSIAIRSDQPAEFLFFNSADNNPCVDQAVIFETSNPEPQFSYRWRFGSRANPREASGPGPHEVTYSNTGFNSGRYYISDQFGEQSVLFRMNVQDEPSINNISEEELDLGLFLFGAEVESGNEYLWDFGDGNTSTEEAPTHLYENSGLYDVSLKLTGPCGEDNFTKEVEVLNTVSTNDLDISGITLSPNPNDGYFTLKLPEIKNETAQLKLMSISGVVVDVRTVKAGTGSKLVAYEDIRPGTYILSIVVGQESRSLKIAVQ